MARKVSDARPTPVEDDRVDWRSPEAEREARAYWDLPFGAPDPFEGRPYPNWYYAYL